MKRFSFPKSKRLISNKQFETVLAHKNCVSDDLLVLYTAENDCGCPRLGVSVGKNFGVAVVRNRIKRHLREAFRQNQDRIPACFDYLFMISSRWMKKTDKQTKAEKRLRQPTFEQVKSSLLALVSRATQLYDNRCDSDSQK